MKNNMYVNGRNIGRRNIRLQNNEKRKTETVFRKELKIHAYIIKG